MIIRAPSPSWRCRRQPRGIGKPTSSSSARVRPACPRPSLRAKPGPPSYLVEAEPDIGGHAIVSGGNVPLGGGTSAQRSAEIEDSTDLVFLDNTDWSVVQPNGFPDYRYNDRELVRVFADENVATYDWLLAHGVVFADKAPDAFGGTSIGNSVPREMHAVPMHWTIAQRANPSPRSPRQPDRPATV